jgi:phage shock protein A
MMGELRGEIEDELVAAEREIASLRIARDRTSQKLEKLLRERDRLYRHLSALDKADNDSEVV